MTAAGITLLRGLPGSGKTTFARILVAGAARRVGDRLVRSNRDDIRRAAFGSSYRYEDHEDLVKATQLAHAREALRRGWDVVVDDTNLKIGTVHEWADLAHSEGAGLIVDDSCLQTPLEECIRRDAARPDPECVGEAVIRDLYRRYLEHRTLPTVAELSPVVGRPYEVPAGASDSYAVLVDVDGTVALPGGRDVHDPSRYAEDLPNQPVVDLVRTLSMTGCLVVFCSGRVEAYREVTEDWIDEHVGVPYSLHLRPDDDNRHDSIAKLALFDEHIRDRYRIQLVLEDRARVVRMWRDLGLTVLQVAEGAF